MHWTDRRLRFPVGAAPLRQAYQIRQKPAGTVDNRRHHKRHTRLRKDILWRFSKRINVPPLKERRTDIFSILLGKMNEFNEKKKTKGNQNITYEWIIHPLEFMLFFIDPFEGNVRELLNSI